MALLFLIITIVVVLSSNSSITVTITSFLTIFSAPKCDNLFLVLRLKVILPVNNDFIQGLDSWGTIL